jgi:hypothetical protein
MIVVGQVIVEERDEEKAPSRAALTTCAAPFSVLLFLGTLGHFSLPGWEELDTPMP